MITIGFKVTESQKQIIHKIIEIVAKEKGLNKGESLVYIIESFYIPKINIDDIKKELNSILKQIDDIQMISLNKKDDRR